MPRMHPSYERVEVVALFVSHCLAVFGCSVLLVERYWIGRLAVVWDNRHVLCYHSRDGLAWLT